MTIENNSKSRGRHWLITYAKYAARLVLIGFTSIILSACSFGHKQYKTEYISQENIGLPKLRNCVGDPSGASNYYLFHDSSCLRENRAQSVAQNTIAESSKNIDFRYGNYTFGVVEFDDYGELFDANQLNNVRLAIKDIAANRPVVFFLFIHGWRHNASENSSNLREFRAFIQGLGNTSCFDIWRNSGVCQDDDSTERPHVIGVYLGWRGDVFGANEIRKFTGDSAITEAIRSTQLLSIYNRKKAAKQIATTRATSTILSLLQALEEGDNLRELSFAEAQIHDISKAPFLESKKFLVGHSFGARFLENALSQSFLGRRHLSVQLGLTRELENLAQKLNMVDSEITKVYGLFNQLEASHQAALNSLLRQQRAKTRSCNKFESEEKSINKLKERVGNYQQHGLPKLVAALSDIATKLKEIEIETATVAQASTEDRGSNTYPSSIEMEALCVQPDGEGKSENEICDFINDLRAWRLSLRNTVQRFKEDAQISDSDIKTVEELYEENQLRTGFLYLWERATEKNLEVVERKRYLREHIHHTMKTLSYDEEVDKKVYHVRELQASLELETKRGLLAKSKDKCELDKINARQKEESLKGYEVHFESYRRLFDDHLVELSKNIYSLKKLVRKGLFPPVDLALLVNPATEALQAKMLIESMCDDRAFSDLANKLLPNRKPWFISIKSTGDDATGKAFNVIATLEADYVFTKAPPRRYTPRKAVDTATCDLFSDMVSQRRYVTQTAPSLDEFQTHLLEERLAPLTFRYLDDKNSERDKDLLAGVYEGYLQATSYQKIQNDSNHKHRTKPVFSFESEGRLYQLWPHNGPQKIWLNEFSDYWNFSVPEAIVADHNDIFQPRFGRLLGAIIQSQTNANFCPSLEVANHSQTEECPDLLDTANYCALLNKFSCMRNRLSAMKHAK